MRESNEHQKLFRRNARPRSSLVEAHERRRRYTRATWPLGSQWCPTHAKIRWAQLRRLVLKKGRYREVDSAWGKDKSLHIHGITAVAEVEATRLLLASAERESGLGLLGSKLLNVTTGLVLVREVLLDDVVSLHVDLLVGIVLAIVDLLHATGLFDEESVAVDTSLAGLASLLVHVSDLEDVLKTIESDLDDLVVRAGQEITQGLDAPLRNKVTDLIGLLKTTGSGVGDSPASLLAGLEVTVGKQVDKRSDNASVDDCLDLAGVTSSDVGDGPASFLADTILGGAQEGEQSRERATVDDDLGLDVITSDNVTHGTEGGGLDRGRSVHKELHEATGDTGLDNGLDLVIGTIGQIRDSPASVNQDLVIQHVDELGKDGKGRGDGVPVRLGSLATAEVAESPGSVAEHAQLAAIIDEVKKGAQSTGTKNKVTAVRAVTSNVSKGPHGLFTDIGLRAAKQLDEDGDGTSFDDDLGLLGGAGGNVGQSPGRLKLDQGVRRAKELDETGNDTGLDNTLDRGVALLGKQFAELGGGLNLLLNLIGENSLHHLGKLDVELNNPLCQLDNSHDIFFYCSGARARRSELEGLRGPWQQGGEKNSLLMIAS